MDVSSASPTSELSELIRALDRATVADLKFTTEQLSVHSMIPERKVGYRLVEIGATPITFPVAIPYVRAEGPKGVRWYVVDNSPRYSAEKFNTISAMSEEEAKNIVLGRLRSVIRIMIDNV